MSRKSWALSGGTQTDSPHLTKLKLIQSYLVIAYAISLPLSLTASWLLLIAGLFIWAIEAATCPGLGFNKLTKAPLTLPLLGFALVVFLSGALVGGINEAFQSVWSLKHLVVYFWAFQAFVDNRRLLFISVQAILVVGAIAGAWGSIQQVTGFHPFGYPYLQGTGFLAGPMAYAGQMQLFGFLALAIFTGSGYKNFSAGLNKPWLFGIVCLLNVLGILFASERSAWLGALVAVLAMGIAMSWKNLAKIFLVLLLLTVFSWNFVPVVKTRLEPLSNWKQDVSVAVRIFLWGESVKIWRSSPVAGVGIRQFPHFNIPEAVVPGRAIDINHAHSNYLHILATTGVAGTVLFLFIWIKALFVGARIYMWRPPGELVETYLPVRVLALGIFAGTVSMMVAGIFEYNFGTAQVRLTQWFLLGMLPSLSMLAVHADSSDSS